MILYVGDDMVDLYPKSNVFYTIQRVNIGNLTARSVNYTNSFTAPWTENNERIFGFAKHEGTIDPSVYRLRPCKIVNGIEVTNDSVLYITKSSEREFSLQIYENIFDYFLSINDKNISEIDPIASSAWRASDIDAARLSTDGLVTALIDWGVPLYNPVIFMPSFYYHSIIKAILEFTGFTIEGDILTDPRFTDLVIPFPGNKFEYPETYKSQFNYLNPLPADQVVVGSTGQVSILGQSVTEYLHGTYFMRISLGGIAWTGGTKLYLLLEKNGDIVASNLIAESPAPGISYEMEWTGFVEPGDSINYYVLADATGAGIDYTVVSGAGLSTFMRFTPSGIVNRDMVNWNALLPEVKCSDLLKEFFNRFGIIPKQVENTIILKTLHEVMSDTINAVDWSSKLVNRNKKEISFKNEYAQQNLFSYNDLVDDPTLGNGSIDVDSDILALSKTMYKSIFGNTNTIQYFGWRLASIPIFEQPDLGIEGFEDGRVVTAGSAILQADEDTAVRLSGTFNFTIDVLMLSTQVALRNIGSGVVTLVEGAGISLPLGSFAIPAGFYVVIVYRDTSDPDLFLYKDEQIAEFTESPGLRLLTLKDRTTENSVTFDVAARTDYKIGYFVDATLDKDTGFQYFIDEFYALLEAALQRNKLIMKNYDLNDIDINSFDVHKMMHDGEGYYLVNKIPNYSSTKISKGEIFKVM